MIRPLFAIAGVLLLSIQILNLPLSIGYFYANQAEIAATQCVNRTETVVLCSGRCVLREIVVAQLDGSTDDGPAGPASLTDIVKPVVMEQPAARWQPAPVSHRSRAILPTANYRYRMGVSSDHLVDIFHPPRRA